MPNRMISLERNTNETQIDLTLDLDGTGRSQVRGQIRIIGNETKGRRRHESIVVNNNAVDRSRTDCVDCNREVSRSCDVECRCGGENHYVHYDIGIRFGYEGRVVMQN